MARQANDLRFFAAASLPAKETRLFVRRHGDAFDTKHEVAVLATVSTLAVAIEACESSELSKSKSDLTKCDSERDQRERERKKSHREEVWSDTNRLDSLYFIVYYALSGVPR